YHININDDILQLLRDAAAYTEIALDNIAHREPITIPRLSQFVARVHELREIHVAPLVRLQEADDSGKRPVDPELLAIFMAEEMNLLLNADQIISHWQATPDDLEQLDPMIKELRNLTHGAAHAYLPPMADLGNRLQQIYQAVINKELEISDDLCATLNSAHLALLDMVDAVAAGQNLSAIPPAVEAALANYCGEPTLPVPELETETETETNDETTTASTNDEVKAEDIEVEPDSNLEPTHHLEQDITTADSTDESETEFVERPDTQAVMADEQEDVDAVAASEFSEPE